MSDKIMINNIDVSGCEFYRDECCYCTDTSDFYVPENCKRLICNLNLNCYYKQFKRTQNQYNVVVEQNKSLQQQLQAEKEKVKELLER